MKLPIREKTFPRRFTIQTNALTNERGVQIRGAFDHLKTQYLFFSIEDAYAYAIGLKVQLSLKLRSRSEQVGANDSGFESGVEERFFTCSISYSYVIHHWTVQNNATISFFLLGFHLVGHKILTTSYHSGLVRFMSDVTLVIIQLTLHCLLYVG